MEDDEVPEDLPAGASPFPDEHGALGNKDGPAAMIEDEDLPKEQLTNTAAAEPSSPPARPVPSPPAKPVLSEAQLKQRWSRVHPEVEAAVRKIQSLFRYRIVRRTILEAIRGKFELVYDSDFGEYFYFNKETGESQWHKPLLLKTNELYADDAQSSAAATKIQAIMRGNLARQKLLEKIKKMFRKEYDPKTGDFYYVHLDTEEVSWDPPGSRFLGSKAPEIEVQSESKLMLERDAEIERLRKEIASKDKEIERVRSSKLHQLQEEDRSLRLVAALRGSKRSKEMDEWTVEHVVAWFDEMEQLSQYCTALTKNRIDGILLLNMDTVDLEELGITNKLHQRRLNVALKKYKDRYEQKQAGEEASEGEDDGSLGSETPSELLEEEALLTSDEESEVESEDELVPTEEELLEIKQDNENIAITIKFPGNGIDHPALGDIVRCHYSMYVVQKTGLRLVESSRKMRKRPLEFVLGVNQVIVGWERALVKMTVEERSKIRLSALYAYGADGAPPLIPPNSPIELDVELLSIRKRPYWNKLLVQPSMHSDRPYHVDDPFKERQGADAEAISDEDEEAGA